MYSFFTSSTPVIEGEKKHQQGIYVESLTRLQSHQKPSGMQKAEGKPEKPREAEADQRRGDRDVKMERQRRQRGTNRDEERDGQTGMLRERPL